MSAIGVVVIGAILGGVIQILNAGRDRRRQARAAALVVGDALTEALIRNHEPQGNPFRPVVVDYSAYAVVWETERKAVALVMTAEDYATVSKAFGELRRIGKMETVGLDLRNVVFDALYEAGQACEFGRRVTYRYSRSAWEKFGAWTAAKRKDVVKSSEYRQLDRAWRKAREAEAQKQ